MQATPTNMIKAIREEYPTLSEDELMQMPWINLVFMCDAIAFKKSVAQHRQQCSICATASTESRRDDERTTA